MARPIRIGVDGRVLALPAMRGWTRYAGNLLRALEARGDVEIVVFAREAPHAAHLAGLRSRVVRFDAPREALWNDWLLPRRLRAEGIDVFHALADRGLPAWKPCPLVVTLHNSFERAHWRTLYRGVKRRLWYWKHELVNARRADAVVTVSDTTRAELLRFGVCPPEKLARVYLAPAPEFRPEADPDDDAVRARHRIDAPYLLFVGGYDAHKNVETLVRAFVRSGVDDHLLVIAAEKTSASAPMRDAWGRHARVRCIEPVPGEMPALVRGATCLAHPSTWESFALPLVEAMACGTPVVAARASAMPEIVGDAAVGFDPGDVGALAAALADVVADAGRRAEMRARGLARARAFSWERTAEETVDVYRKVLAA